MQNTKTSLWTVSQMDGPCDFPFSLLMDKLFPLGQYKQTNLFWSEQASQTWLVFFPLFFPSVGKEKVYIQPKEKKARTKLCLLCVCSQSSRCLELSAQPSHSFPHQCAIVFIALHSPRIFFASLTLSLVCLIYPHITDIFNQPEPRLVIFFWTEINAGCYLLSHLTR